VQFASAVSPDAEVFLCAGQAVHSLLLRAGSKKACAHGMHGLIGVYIFGLIFVSASKASEQDS
jgi:hypothetical protein